MIDVANGKPAPDEARIDLSLAIVVQFLRTLDFRNNLIDSYEKSAAALAESVLEMVRPDLAERLEIKAKYGKYAVALQRVED